MAAAPLCALAGGDGGVVGGGVGLTSASSMLPAVGSCAAVARGSRNGDGGCDDIAESLSSSVDDDVCPRSNASALKTPRVQKYSRR